MQEEKYTEFLESRRQSKEAIQSAVGYVREFEAYLAERGVSLDAFTVPDLKDYAASVIDRKKNSMERFVALARYAYMASLNEVFIYFTAMLGGREVLPSIAAELAAVAGEKTREEVFIDIELPPLGSPPEEFPEVTCRLVGKLLDLGEETCHRVLACNHHGIPPEHFDKHKTWLEEAGSLEAFLKRVHQEAVSELEQHAAEGKVWYEQEITPGVVEFVRDNQEVLSAVREGDYLYKTKIPYSPKDWLEERDPLLKRYYACHCPLARAAIIKGETEIPIDWCYCSAGYGKLMFDVIFGEPTEVEVLESVLAGASRCRFRIKIPAGKL